MGLTTALGKPSTVLERTMQRWFARYGRFAARRPLLLIALGVAVFVVCGLGVMSLDTSLQNQSDLWASRGSRAWKDRNTLTGIFDDLQSRGSILVLLRTRAPESIVEQASLEAAFHIEQAIAAQVTSNGNTYPNVCLHGRFDRACTRASLFRSLNITSADEIHSDEILAVLQSGMVDVARAFGEVEYDDDGVFVGARVMGMGFAVDMPVGGDQDDGYAFMRAVDNYLVDMDNTSPVLDIAWHSNAFENSEMTRTVMSEVPLVLGSAVIIFGLLMVLLGGRPPRNSRLMLGTVIVLVVLMDMVIIFGLCGWFHLPLTVISLLMMFVMLGIGVDDIIIVTRSLEAAAHLPDLEDAMGFAMEQAGFPIFITTWSSFIAFLAGCYIDLYAIAYFCLTGVFGVIGIYFLTLTVFSGLLVLDERRRRARRFDCLCCFGAQGQGDGAPGVVELAAHAAVDNAEKPSVPVDRPSAKAASAAHVATDGSRTTRMLMAMVDWMTHPKYGKFVCLGIIAFFVGLFVAATIGATDHPNTELNALDLFPDDSRIRDLYAWSADLKLGGNELYLVAREADYTDAAVQQSLVDALDDAALEVEYVHPPFVCWVRALRHFANATDREAELAGEGFYGLLGDFLATPQFTYIDDNGDERSDNGTSYAPDLKFQNGVIVAARLRASLSASTEMETNQRVATHVRRAITSRFDDGVAWTIFLDDVDREARTLDTIKRTLMFTAACTTLALLLVLHPGLALLLSVGVVMIDVDIIGFAVWWGVRLDGITLTCIIMAIGLSIDYIVHIGHAYMIEQGTAEQRLRAAFSQMGTSVLLGGVTTFAGVCLTAAARSTGFRTFFKLLFLTTSFGVVHGIFLAPTLLYVVFVARERLAARSSQHRGAPHWANVLWPSEGKAQPNP